MSETDIQQALRAIFDRLGGIDAKLESGSNRHKEMAQGIAELDGKFDDLTERVGKVEGLASRVAIIEPTLWELEGKRLERQGQKKLVGGVFKISHAIYAAAGGALTWLGHQILTMPWPKP